MHWPQFSCGNVAVRVPRYDHQEKTLLRSLFTTFAAELQAALGFTCDDAMVLEECMTQRIQTMALQGQDIALHVMDDVKPRLTRSTGK